MEPGPDSMKLDPDFLWLLSHAPERQTLQRRSDLAHSVSELLHVRIKAGQLPYTLGIFGGWGVGKTTFLALLAKELERLPQIRVVYFNSWKYAGFMEIVPSLIYKIMQYGVRKSEQKRNEAATRVLLSLGKEYSDRFGQWAEQRIGINPVSLFKDVHKVGEIAGGLREMVRPELLAAYYNQVDKAQDALAEVLGELKPGEEAEEPIVVLIDELDRCDPDEAFNVIKQMRVLFSMRHIPVAFVVCANPEPIGLAIKHRYGLESETGDYEARRILEKFVDAYADLSEALPLGDLILDLWQDVPVEQRPWILEIDAANGESDYNQDTVHNASGYDAMTSGIALYANLRVLRKSFEYVNQRVLYNSDLLWSLWHLDIMSQLDPGMRKNFRSLAAEFHTISVRAYNALAGISYSVATKKRKRSLTFHSDKGKTLFAFFRSTFWDIAKSHLDDLRERSDPQSRSNSKLLEELLSDHMSMDFVILTFLVPLPGAPGHSTLCQSAEGTLAPIRAVYDTVCMSLSWSIST